MNNKYFLLRILIKIKGIILFLLLLIVPLLIIEYLKKNEKISIISYVLNDTFIFITFNYLLIICLLFVIYLSKRNLINFFSKENWFISLGKALVPASISFGIAFFTLIFIISLVEFLPFPEFIKNWIKIPNQGFIEIFDVIDKEQYIKVLLWFFYIIVLAPVIEEIMFRGYLQESISYIVKNKKSVIFLTSFIFSLFHINSLSNALYSFIIGLYLSKEKENNRSINVSIWIHSIINFTGLIYAILAKYFFKGSI